jgi:hypothetical protein
MLIHTAPSPEQNDPLFSYNQNNRNYSAGGENGGFVEF